MKPVEEKPIDREEWARVDEYLRKTLDQDELTHCMRCGFCLPACPTYRETGLEQASPRGRLDLMKAVADGMIEPDAAFADQMNLCLGCRACETACPAGVQYGRVLEQTRAGIALREPSSRIVRGLRNLFFKHLFPHQHRLRTLGWWLTLYQRSGLRWLVQRSGLMRLFPEHLREMEAVMPPASSKGVRERLGEILRPEGTPKGRVGLFRGCIMDGSLRKPTVIRLGCWSRRATKWSSLMRSGVAARCMPMPEKRIRPNDWLAKTLRPFAMRKWNGSSPTQAAVGPCWWNTPIISKGTCGWRRMLDGSPAGYVTSANLSLM